MFARCLRSHRTHRRAESRASRSRRRARVRIDARRRARPPRVARAARRVRATRIDARERQPPRRRVDATRARDATATATATATARGDARRSTRARATASTISDEVARQSATYLPQVLQSAARLNVAEVLAYATIFSFSLMLAVGALRPALVVVHNAWMRARRRDEDEEFAESVLASSICWREARCSRRVGVRVRGDRADREPGRARAVTARTRGANAEDCILRKRGDELSEKVSRESGGRLAAQNVRFEGTD